MFARTDRLLLRPGWSEDAFALAHASANDSELNHLFPASGPLDGDSMSRYLSRHRDADAELLILLRTNDEPLVIGEVGIRPSPKGDSFRFWISRDHRGQGFATEAGQAMMDIASYALGLRQISATPLADNKAAHRVLDKLGFQAIGRTMRADGTGDSLTPASLYARELANQGSQIPPLAA